MELRQLVTQHFQNRFGEAPTFVIRAPGRVNLIGEHTDYNDGFVMPMAIDRAVWIALRPRADRRVEVDALDFDAPLQFDLDAFEKESSSPAEYVKGVAWALASSGYQISGWEGVLKGDVPIGAGLSSSAALELAVARSFHAIEGFEWNPAKMALLAQKAENQWVGVNSGIMDQMISASGKEGHALLIDCRSLDTESLPVPAGLAVVVLDTGTRRELVTSAYNERRAQCEAAAAHFGVSKLRDISVAQFEAGKAGLDDVTLRRGRHVVTENDRVQQAKAAMIANDALALGQLLNQSHVSLRDDFEVSSAALDTIVAAAQDHPACVGARMTGAGFGGCAVALVREESVADFVEQVTKRYTAETPHTPAVYVCRATNGAEIL
jgi:galactokinase